MSGITGVVSDDPVELRRVATQKKRSFLSDTIPTSSLDERLRDGWQAVRQNRNGTTRIRKDKPLDVTFEDRVWMAFYRMGFPMLNLDRQCRVACDGRSKQIDVLARDPETSNAFAVECKSSQSQSPISTLRVLRELTGAYDDICTGLRAQWGRRSGRVSILVVTSSPEKLERERAFVSDNRSRNLLLWSLSDLEYVEKMAAQVGSLARHQLYAITLSDKDTRSLARPYPALRAKMGQRTFYSFLIPAKDLLKYAYIHHRKLTEVAEAAQAYQRMLKPAKLREIVDYIDAEHRYFPNSVVVNFAGNLRWQQHESFDGGVATGMITLPGRYGSAWVIDGQHRLYGAARAQHDVLLPVIAFEDIGQGEQARLFVDINQKQTTVPSSLLWDLYCDIYREDSSPHNQRLYQVAETARALATAGPMAGRIAVESLGMSGAASLSLTTVCTTINHFSPWDQLRHPSEPGRTPERAARLIGTYIEALQLVWPEEWQLTQGGWLFTNNAFTILYMVFRDLVVHLYAAGQSRLFTEGASVELRRAFVELLQPVAEKMRADDRERANVTENIRRATGRGPQGEVAAYLDVLIQEANPGFSAARMQDRALPRSPTLTSEPELVSRCRKAEEHLRSRVERDLMAYYPEDLWWRRGVPGNVKDALDRRWEQEVRANPSLGREVDPTARKYTLIDLGQLMDVILYGSNWTELFDDVFGTKENVKLRIGQVKRLRDAGAHGREIDQIVLRDGAAGLCWLAVNLPDPELHPDE